MKISKLILENFRCFEKYEVKFAKKTTVLIGKNGTGKTNLLTAIVYSLSFPFAKNKMQGKQTIATSNPDLKIAEIDTKGRYDSRYDDKIDDYIYPLRLINEAFFDNKVIKWAMVKETRSGSILPSQYKEAFEIFHHYYNENAVNKPLPVLAYFSDFFPHIESNMSVFTKSILNSDIGIPRNFGYYKWDEKTNCIGIWKEKFIQSFQGMVAMNMATSDKYAHINTLSQQLTETDGTTEQYNIRKQISELNSEINIFQQSIYDTIDYQEISFVESKLKKFTEPLRPELKSLNEDFEIERVLVRGTKKIGLRIILLFKTGRSIYFDDLPQGFKRLFSIVFDISYRSFILNKNSETTGIVIIDEVELHLHPTLQQEVLQRFQITFPELQFVVSTHSPLVISNLKADGIENKIIKLENDGNNYFNETLTNIYGIDYTTGLMEIMGAKYRESSIDNLIDSIVILASRNRVEDAERLKNELYAIVGENNTHIKKEIETRIEMNKK